MNEIIEQLKEAVSQFSPNLLGALVVLVAGWIIALLAAALTRRLFCAALSSTTSWRNG